MNILFSVYLNKKFSKFKLFKYGADFLKSAIHAHFTSLYTEV